MGCFDSECSPWSDLPPEILDLIIQKLSIADVCTFGKVCISWRVVFLDNRRLRHPPPCLMLEPVSDEPEQTPIVSYKNQHKPRLWSLHDGQFFRLHSPGPKMLPSEMVCSSSQGWLLILSATLFSHSLLNPSTNQRIPLPLSEYRFEQIVLSSPPTCTDCVIVAVARSCYESYEGQSDYRFFWCVPGDLNWTMDSTPLSYPVSMRFHKGQLYYAFGKSIMVYNFDPRAKKMVLGSTKICKIKCDNTALERFVELRGELLMVARVNYNTLDVFMLVEGQEDRWVRVKSLGDWVLLIGFGSESCCTKDLIGSGFEANCIYTATMGARYLVKFSMADGSREYIYLPPDHEACTWHLSKWIPGQ